MKAPRQKRISLTGIVGAIGLLCSVVLLCEVTLSITCGLSLFFPRGRQGEHDAQQQQQSFSPDVIVLTAFGSNFINTGSSVRSLLEACACSLRSRGQYDGDIVLLTDQVEALASTSLISRYGVKLLAHPPVNDMLRLYALKCQLLHLLPMSYHSILYLVGVAAHPARN
jgi:predicted RNA polymerase sigma factor